jgi:hypothetical protein
MCLVAFFTITRDPLFLVLTAVIGLGFILSLSAYLHDRRPLAGS